MELLVARVELKEKPKKIKFEKIQELLKENTHQM